MSGKCFVDTNVLIYAHDISTGAKHSHASALVESLWHAGNGVLSTQVLQEFCAVAQRKLSASFPLDDLLTAVSAYLAWEVVINTPHSVVSALQVSSRYRVTFWEALILSAAQNAAATTLYSEDFSHGQAYGSVRVINPFVI